MTKRCIAFPECPCGQVNDYWHDYDRADEPPLSRGELEDIRFGFIKTLKCLVKNHPDPVQRRNAAIQLLDPVFQEGEGFRWLALF